MTGAIRNSNISTKGGMLAAIIFVAAFASVQVACLTHTHCDGAGCLDYRDESCEPPGHEDHQDHDAHRECSHEEDHSQDIHHHSHDGQTHPPKRFTVPVDEPGFSDTARSETPVIELANFTPLFEDPPPLVRYGLIFAERAPPRS